MPLLGTRGAASAKGFGFTAGAEGPPTVIGQAYGGGFYGGKINYGGGQVYYLIVSPAASGQQRRDFGIVSDVVGIAAQSDVDGLQNTNAYVAYDPVKYPGPTWARSLTIGGYTDWYIPAKNELETLYYFLKPDTTNNATNSGSNPNAVAPEPISTNYTISAPARTTAVPFWTGQPQAFEVGQYTFSSTEYPNFWVWVTNFSTGEQFPNAQPKGTNNYIRVIRKVLVV